MSSGHSWTADCPFTDNQALGKAFEDAETLLLARLGEVTLTALSADFHQHTTGSGFEHELEHMHA